MKVAYLVDKAGPLYIGGYEVRAQKLAAFLGRRNEVRVYTSMDRPNMRFGDVEYVKVSPTSFQSDRSGQRSLIHSWIFANCLRSDPFTDWHPDAVIVEAIPYAHLAAMTSWASKSGRTYVLSVNEAWYDYAYGPRILATPSRWYLRRLMRQGIDFSTHVVAISRPTAESLRLNYCVEDVQRVPMGIDQEVLTAVATPPLLDRRYDFITMGRLVRIKRVDVFIEALSFLRHCYGWKGRAAILGGGSLRPSLETLARTLGVAKQVEFLGLVPEKEKYKALSSGRIFVLPSEREGFSMATLEAMALGLPAVVAKPQTADVFGTSDFVHDGADGRFFPVGNSAELARILDGLLRETELTAALSKQARRVALSYTWDAAGSKMQELLDHTLHL
jgi:glycosyltransferase involved in cell wall biosynthesis